MKSTRGLLLPGNVYIGGTASFSHGLYFPCKKNMMSYITHTHISFASNHPPFQARGKNTRCWQLKTTEIPTFVGIVHIYTSHQGYNMWNVYMKQIVKLALPALPNSQFSVFLTLTSSLKSTLSQRYISTRCVLDVEISTRSKVAFYNPGSHRIVHVTPYACPALLLIALSI